MGEVKANLLAEERKKSLAAFPSQNFKRICQVRMGEPDEEFKAGVTEQILAGKRAKAEEEKKKKAELAKKKAEAAKAARIAKAKGEEVPAEEPKDETMEEDQKEPEEEIVAEEVSLTDEDRKVRFTKQSIPDLLPAEVSATFSKFSLPDNEEGFDRVEFCWNS